MFFKSQDDRIYSIGTVKFLTFVDGELDLNEEPAKVGTVWTSVGAKTAIISWTLLPADLFTRNGITILELRR